MKFIYQCISNHVWPILTKSTFIFKAGCNWDCKWECILNALENALKNGLKGANECKIWPIKNWKYGWECKRKNDKCVWVALDDTIQSAPDNTPGVAPKDELQ